MAYNPATDFLALLRQTAGGVRTERMPGLDYVVAALARMGFITLSVGQNPPVANQSTTAWFQPALTDWTAEGTFYLWNANVAAYQVATPALWQAFILPAGGNYQFQSITLGAAFITSGVTLAAIQRAGPATTAITLPNLGAQFNSGRKLQIVDYSTAVLQHTITLTTPDGAKIMQSNSFQLISTPDQLAGVLLTPSLDLNAWVITP